MRLILGVVLFLLTGLAVGAVVARWAHRNWTMLAGTSATICAVLTGFILLSLMVGLLCFIGVPGVWVCVLVLQLGRTMARHGHSCRP
ncbi:MAG TPA: hypothetical protein VGO93_26575 [Candidatus Xenobia bacterium]